MEINLFVLEKVLSSIKAILKDEHTSICSGYIKKMNKNYIKQQAGKKILQ